MIVKEGAQMIKKVAFTLILMVILSVVACASHVKKESAPPPPQWTTQSGFVQNGENLSVVGRAFEKASRSDAETVAFVNALVEISRYFGVQIESELSDKAEESNGLYSYSIGAKNKITGAQIKISHFNKAALYTEEKEGVYSSCILLSIPLKEVARIEKEVKGIADWSLFSSDEVKDEMRDFIKTFASKKGIKIAPQEKIVSQNLPAKELSTLSDNAYFLQLESENSEPVQEGKVWVTRVKIRVRIISLTEDREVETIAEELKWGEYTSELAVKKGFKKLTEKILNKI